MGSLLFYVRSADNTILNALNIIVRQIGSATDLTEKWTTQLLNYMETQPDATLPYWDSEMILKGHSDASYLNKDNTISRFAGYFFMGHKQHYIQPFCLNGAIVVTVSILKLVAASAAEAELGGIFQNGQTETKLRLTLM